MIYLFDFIILSSIIFFMRFGYKKGIVRSVLSLCASIFSFWIAGFVSTFLANKIFTIFVRPTLFSNVSQALASETAQIGDLTKVSKIINCCPKFLQGSLSNYNITNDAILSKIGLSTYTAAQQITDMMSPIFINFIRIITMACLVTAFLILFRIFIRMICRLFDIPVLKQINQLLGMLFGALKGIVVVMLAVFFIRLALPLSQDYKSKTFSDENINKSCLFKLIYHNNVYDEIFYDQKK